MPRWELQGKNNIETKDSVLIYDIETSSPYGISDIQNYTKYATCKWFGAYSFVTQKYYIYTYHERRAIQKLIDKHKVAVTFNGKSFDNPILKNHINQICLDYKIQVDLLRVLYNPEFRCSNREAILKYEGRVLRDILPNHKLKTIAEKLGLTVEKGDIDYNIFKKMSWTPDETDNIIKYLYADIKITKELFEYMYKEFLPMKEFMCKDDQRKYNWFRTSIGSYAFKVICHKAGLKEEYGECGDKKQYTGGDVMQPEIEHVNGDIYCLDFSSAYPHSFMMGNLYSPADRNDKTAFTGNKMFPITGCYKTDSMGKIETVIKEFYHLRLKYKKDKDPREYAIKLILNTIYGISSSPVFKSVYNLDTASDCTLIARNMIRHARKTFQDNGYDLLYSDTDSVYIVDKFNDKEKMLAVRDKIITDIKSNLPFPQKTFDMTIDDEISGIWFFKDDMDEFRKKHYIYITKENKIKIKGLPLIQSKCSRMAKKVYAIIKPMILANQDIKFTRDYIEKLVMDMMKIDIGLVANYYKVKQPEMYNSKTCIHYQISKKYGVNDKEFKEEHWLIPNKRIGQVGKFKKYCSLDEGKDLKLDDLELDVLWNSELAPFITDFIHPKLLKRQQRAIEQYEKGKNKKIQDYLDSDLFDSDSVGSDITDREFFDNEMDFAMEQ